MKLLVATSNVGKLVEIREILAGIALELLSLREVRLPAPDEMGATFHDSFPDTASAWRTACQYTICRHAVSSIHAPIGTIRPVSSARGMNSDGATNPRSGWFQRSNASKPTTRPLRRLVIGW